MSRSKKQEPKIMPAELLIKARSFTGLSVYGQQKGAAGCYDVAALSMDKDLVLISQADIDLALDLARQEARQQLLQELDQTLGAVALPATGTTKDRSQPCSP